MIDRDLINRHLIVTKKNEVTTVEQASESNIFDEEVIYNAMGFSVFEHLKPSNIIFEGWRDKRLFQVALANLPSAHKKLKDRFLEVGLCHAEGARDVPRIASILELANKKCTVLSDGDKPAKEKQKEYRGYGKWFRSDELLTSEPAITAEDFIKPEQFLPAIASVRVSHPQLPDIKADELNSVSKLAHIKVWLERGKIPHDAQKDILNGIKENVFNDLKPSHIEDKYFMLMEQLAIKVENNLLS
jgi:hypothetical protein